MMCGLVGISFVPGVGWGWGGDGVGGEEAALATCDTSSCVSVASGLSFIYWFVGVDILYRCL